MVSKIKQRLASDEGFTLIELLVVIVILGILLAIAVPSYLGFKDRANKSAAQANVRASLPAAEAYYSDHGNYTGMTISKLRTSYDAGIKLNTVKLTGTKTYCVDAASGGFTYAVTNPGGTIAAGHC
jgi:type IV pilus assembly protein PilA